MSRSFGSWHVTQGDIRTFLALSESWGQAAYQAEWAKAEKEFAAHFDPDRDDVDGHVDAFNEAVGGLWPSDFSWMLRAAALKDAVTAFEVYLERALDEVFSAHLAVDDEGRRLRLQVTRPKRSGAPDYKVLVRLHRLLGNEVDTEAVRHIRELRHLLTHQRGELRTEEQRLRFSDERHEDELSLTPYVGGEMPLRVERVQELLDDLGAVVRGADPAVWRYSAWGGEGLPEMTGSILKLLECTPVD